MSAAQPSIAAGVEISLRIGQRVRHHDFHGKRVTGVVRGLSVDEDVLRADIALDEAIVVPPIDADDHELRIYRQFVPAHELAPFDEREELIAALLAALREAEAGLEFAGADKLQATGDFVPAPLTALRAVRAAIARALSTEVKS